MTAYWVIGLAMLIVLAAGAVLWLRRSGGSVNGEAPPGLELEFDHRRPPTYEVNQGRPILSIGVRNPAPCPVTIREVRLRVGQDPPVVDVELSREDYFGGSRLLPCRLDPGGGATSFWVDITRLRDLIAAGLNGGDSDPTVRIAVRDSLERTRSAVIPPSEYGDEKPSAQRRV